MQQLNSWVHELRALDWALLPPSAPNRGSVRSGSALCHASISNFTAWVRTPSPPLRSHTQLLHTGRATTLLTPR
jgi:hypothetical protein